jgi:DNA excision repair protein ERCC-2
MDNRFLDSAYSRSMPVDWFKSAVTELVSDGILKEVADFWAR